MKRRILMLATILMVVHLFWGCEAVVDPVSIASSQNLQKTQIIEIPEQLDENIIATVMGGGTPDFIDTLLNNSVVSIYGVDTTGDAVIVAFSYTVDEGPAIERIVQIEHSLKHLILYDIAGTPLSGYSITANDSKIDLTVFSGGNFIAMSHSDSPGTEVIAEVLYDGQLSQAVFADDNEFDSAMALYDAVYTGGYDRNLLSPNEQAIIEKAEVIALWTELSTEQETDIETAVQLSLDSDFQGFIDAGYSPDEPVNKLPDWLKAICKMIRIVKKICDIIFGAVVCEYVEVLVLLCDAAEAIL